MLLSLFKSRPTGSATVLVAGVAAAAAIGPVQASGTGVAPDIAAEAGGWPGAWPRPTADAAVRVTGVQVWARLGRLVGAGTVDDELWGPIAAAVGELVKRFDEHEDRLRAIAEAVRRLVEKP